MYSYAYAVFVKLISWHLRDSLTCRFADIIQHLKILKVGARNYGNLFEKVAIKGFEKYVKSIAKSVASSTNFSKKVTEPL